MPTPNNYKVIFNWLGDFRCIFFYFRIEQNSDEENPYSLFMIKI